MTRLGLTARTSLRLGLGNVAAVAVHRLSGRLGRHNRPAYHRLAPGPLFDLAEIAPPPAVENAGITLDRARRIAGGELQIFGHEWVRLGAPYDWNANVLPTDWGGRDIKGVWEASRFGWAVDLARAHRLSPAEGFLDRLEEFAGSWLAAHPAYEGDNWACGQETSIRMLHLLLANMVLSGTPRITPRLASVVALHLRRIERTLGYAIAQENNHATSEAAALFVGGAVLGSAGVRWRDCGRRALEMLARRLIMADGGFSQTSVNYHRLMLDTLSQAELWRRALHLEPFSAGFCERARAATRWLGALTHARTGAAPNLGNNDGAQVYRLSDRPYGDYRPSVALALALFDGKRPPDEARCADPLAWIDMREPDEVDPFIFCKRSRSFEQFGLTLLNAEEDGTGAYAFIRTPVPRFRPGQADMLHLDLWSAEGENLLIDSGTFSYADSAGARDFVGIGAHNSVMVDEREPMRRLGRFLYADWPRATTTPITRDSGITRWSAAYRDYRGVRHERAVTVSGSQWMIEDRVEGHHIVARLHWRLPDSPIQLEGAGLTTDRITLIVEGSNLRVQLSAAEVSPTYGVRTPASLFTAEASPGEARFVTRIELAP